MCAFFYFSQGRTPDEKRRCGSALLASVFSDLAVSYAPWLSADMWQELWAYHLEEAERRSESASEDGLPAHYPDHACRLGEALLFEKPDSGILWETGSALYKFPEESRTAS